MSSGVRLAVIDGALREGYWLNDVNGVKLNGRVFLERGKRVPWVIYSNDAEYKADKELLAGFTAYHVVNYKVVA
ncbi:hypothetical protein [Priestia megaterium]|uniref:hypothetical protein n=1 Tax=Priestia megaterium TaxID=1404 RepID=UPI002E1C5B17|nr:hypothetical protein [Priestia megaterium]